MLPLYLTPHHSSLTLPHPFLDQEIKLICILSKPCSRYIALLSWNIFGIKQIPTLVIGLFKILVSHPNSVCLKFCHVFKTLFVAISFHQTWSSYFWQQLLRLWNNFQSQLMLMLMLMWVVWIYRPLIMAPHQLPFLMNISSVLLDIGFVDILMNNRKQFWVCLQAYYWEC